MSNAQPLLSHLLSEAHALAEGIQAELKYIAQPCLDTLTLDPAIRRRAALASEALIDIVRRIDDAREYDAARRIVLEDYDIPVAPTARTDRALLLVRHIERAARASARYREHLIASIDPPADDEPIPCVPASTGPDEPRLNFDGLGREPWEREWSRKLALEEKLLARRQKRRAARLSTRRKDLERNAGALASLLEAIAADARALDAPNEETRNQAELRGRAEQRALEHVAQERLTRLQHVAQEHLTRLQYEFRSLPAVERDSIIYTMETASRAYVCALGGGWPRRIRGKLTLSCSASSAITPTVTWHLHVDDDREIATFATWEAARRFVIEWISDIFAREASLVPVRWTFDKTTQRLCASPGAVVLQSADYRWCDLGIEVTSRAWPALVLTVSEIDGLDAATHRRKLLEQRAAKTRQPVPPG